jgi:hypothetical protein
MFKVDQRRREAKFRFPVTFFEKMKLLSPLWNCHLKKLFKESLAT